MNPNMNPNINPNMNPNINPGNANIPQNFGAGNAPILVKPDMALVGPYPNLNRPPQSIDEMMQSQRISSGLSMCPLFTVISQFQYGQMTQDQG
jgi:hypothetical protein